MSYLFNQRTGEKIYKNDEIKDMFGKLRTEFAKGRAQHWAEIQTEHSSGLMIDLDIFSKIQKPQLTNADFMNMADAILRHVVSHLDLPESEFGQDFYVVEIRKPYVMDGLNTSLCWSSKHKLYKDGVHYLFPNLHLSRETKSWLLYSLREAKVIDKIVKKYIIEDPEDIIDQASAYVPALLLGSCKRDKESFYPLGNVYLYDTASDKFNITNINLKKNNPVLEFSLNCWGFETIITDKKHYELNADAQHKLLEWNNERQAAREKVQNENQKYRPSEAEISAIKSNKREFLDITREVVHYFSPERARSFRDWSMVLKCLKNLHLTYNLDSEEVEDIADEFSRMCSEAYKSTSDVLGYFDSCEGFGFFSLLMHWLKEDNSTQCKHIWRRYFAICPPVSKFEYYSDWEKLAYRSKEDIKKNILRTDTTLAEAYEWAKNTIIWIEDAGKSKYLVKTYNQQTRSDIKYDYYQERQFSDLKYDLAIDIDIVSKTESKKTKKPKKIAKPKKNESKKNNKIEEEAEDAEESEEVEDSGEQNETSCVSLATVFMNARTKKLLRRYRSCVCIPYTTNNPVPEDTFNTFCGFPIKAYKSAKKIDFVKSALWTHVYSQLCAGDTVNFKFVEAWIAQMVQQPDQVPGTCIVFSSAQGNGKDLFGKFISKLVGTQHSAIYDNPDMFFSNFNSDMSGVLFTVLNEVSDKGAAHAKHNQLKSFITREEAKIEPKGKDKYKASLYSRYMLFTNNHNPVFVENSDRRFAMFKSKNDHAQNEQYFKTIVNEINDNDFLYAAYDYFATLNIQNVNLRTAPETMYKLEQKIANLSGPLRFVKYVYDEHIDLTDYDGIRRPKKGDVVMSKEALYNMYKTFANQLSDMVVKSDTFFNSIAQIGLVPTRIKIDGKARHSITMDETVILDGFRKYLRTGNFCFDNVVDEAEEEEEVEYTHETMQRDDNLV